MPDSPKPIVYRVHAVQRMFKRYIYEEDVEHVLATGETVEDYPDDKPHPSRLMLGLVGSRPIHIVSAASEHEIIIVTVYEPDPLRWLPGFKKRKP